MNVFERMLLITAFIFSFYAANGGNRFIDEFTSKLTIQYVLWWSAFTVVGYAGIRILLWWFPRFLKWARS